MFYSPACRPCRLTSQRPSMGRATGPAATHHYQWTGTTCPGPHLIRHRTRANDLRVYGPQTLPPDALRLRYLYGSDGHGGPRLQDRAEATS